MKKLMLCLMAAGTFGFMAACDNGNQNDPKEAAENQNDAQFDNSKMQDDAEFAVKAAEGGMMEVQLGQLAQQNGMSQDVKDFGSMMVTDHSKANDDLKALAAQKNITLPAALSNDKQDDYNDLAKKTGADFDKAYMDMMVDDHQKDIDEFKDEAQNGKDADIKAFASNNLPVLQKHLDRAKQINDALK